MKAISVLALLFSTQLSVPHQSATQSDLSSMGLFLFSLSAIVVAPIAETLLNQAIPLEIARKFKIPRFAAMFMSALVFGLMHIREDMAKVIASSATGLLLAWIYLRYRDENFLTDIVTQEIIDAKDTAYKKAIYTDVRWLLSKCPASGVAHTIGVHAVSNGIALAFIIASQI